jgi:HEAT repeat protein
MDLQQMDRLFAQTLTGDYDDESPWNAVRALHGIGSREVFDRAVHWCSSDDPLKRARGADVLAQLGNTSENPGNKFPEESFSIVSDLLKQEKDPLSLLSAVHALGHIGNSRAVPSLIEYRLHPSADVRLAVAFALGNFANDPRTVDTLLALMQDVDEDVRDWATFGLGVQGELDSDQIRDGLFDRLTDPDRNVREESLLGLAKRQDQRALATLIAELNQPEISNRAFEAAEQFLGEGFDKYHL